MCFRRWLGSPQGELFTCSARLLAAFSPLLLSSLPPSSSPPHSPPFDEKVQCRRNLESVSVVPFSRPVTLWYTFSVKFFLSFSSQSCFQSLIPLKMRPETLKIQNHDGKYGNKIWTKAHGLIGRWKTACGVPSCLWLQTFYMLSALGASMCCASNLPMSFPSSVHFESLFPLLVIQFCYL